MSTVPRPTLLCSLRRLRARVPSGLKWVVVCVPVSFSLCVSKNAGTAVPVHARDPAKFQHQVCPAPTSLLFVGLERLEAGPLLSSFSVALMALPASLSPLLCAHTHLPHTRTRS